MQIPPGLPGEAPVVVGIAEIRIEPDRLVEVRERLLDVAVESAGVAAIAVGEREFRIDADRLVVVGEGVLEVALVGVLDAAVVVDRRELTALVSTRRQCARACRDGDVA